MNQPNGQKYLSYQVTDFVLDLSFQQWVQGQPNLFWDSFPVNCPEKSETIRQAADLINQLPNQQQPISTDYLEAQLAKIYATIDRRTSEKKSLDHIKPLPAAARWYQTRLMPYAAAGISLLLISAISYLYWVNAHQAYQTGYQETKTFQLPDGTEVMLNAHSRLQVAPDVETAAVREVWLEGEAFFTVNPSVLAGHAQSFVVHTSQLEVEVLGTEFNVKSRSGSTQVMLEEGSVKVARPETQEHLLMAPGELVEVAAADQQLRKRKREPTALAWRENVFDFRAATLATVARQVRECHGKTIRFDDPAIANYQFTARVSRDDLNLLLSLIEGAFPVKVSTNEDIITITPRAD